ncbi:hypothetical protein M9H77_12328 [Catharanthus roseus]|uniref:Uncharacterized protein n=1 Tax=Catharanthus roseus TaxID=4058 RepID=A0ACC0BH85_CATRO|nr:hypothetical protein M9H77_12328 [Catharanthus roseus]
MEEVPVHVSGLIWIGDRETCYTDLQCRRFGCNLFQCYSSAPRRLVEIIDRTGLGGVFRCGYIGLDHALITVLALWGLGLDGAVVIGPSWSVHPKQYWIDVIERLLGVRLSLNHFSGYKVKKEPLEAWILRAFTGSETDDDLILRAYGFIFLLIGGHMLPDFSGNLVHSAVHGGFGSCTTDRRGLGFSSDLGVVAYTYIAAPADDRDYGRPSRSSWRNMVHNI